MASLESTCAITSLQTEITGLKDEIKKLKEVPDYLEKQTVLDLILEKEKQISEKEKQKTLEKHKALDKEKAGIPQKKAKTVHDFDKVKIYLECVKALTSHPTTMQLDNSDPDIGDDEKSCSVDVLKSPTNGDIKIFERESYLKIYDLLNSTKYTLVTGNPGIGKSYFALYVIYRLMNEESKAYSIIYVNSVHGYSAFIGEDVVEVVSVGDCRSLSYHINANTWYIHDCGTRRGIPDALTASECAKALVCSSPAESNYAEFLKEGYKYGYQILYMPPWSLLECQIWNEVGNPVVNFEERFWHWGGIARIVFSSFFRTRELDQAIKDVGDATEVIKKLSDIAAGRGTQYSHRVLHLFPTNDSYDATEVRFASPYVSREVYRKLVKESVDGVLKLIKNCSGEPTLAGIMGPLFEQLSHENFFKHKGYDVRNLHTGEKSRLMVNAERSEKFKELSEVKDRNVYYYPVSKNFKSVDSILPTDTAFQMTVGKKHPVQYHGLKLVKDQLKCHVLKLYFVVPKKNFANFEIQKYLTTQKKECKVQNKKDIEQFVLSMDIALPIATQ